MQKKIVALAVAGLSTAAFAQTNVTIYGVADLSVQGITASNSKARYNADGSVMEVQSNSSLMGFKGSEDLGNGVKALFQAETTLDLAGNQNGTAGKSGVSYGNSGGVFSSGLRDSFVGVNTKYGTGLAGYLSTPMRSALTSFDVMPGATGSGQIEKQMTQMKFGMSGAQYGTSLRATAIAYAMPTLYGFDASIAYTGSNNNGTTNATEATQCTNAQLSACSIAPQSAWGLNLGWTGYGVNVKGAFQQNNNNTLASTTNLNAGNYGDYTSYLVGAMYTGIQGLKVSGVYVRNSLGTNGPTALTTNGAGKISNNQWWMGTSYRMGNWEPRVSAVFSSDMDGSSVQQLGSRQWTANVGYYLSKRTQVYGLISNVNNSANQSFDLGQQTSKMGTGAAGMNLFTYGMGMRTTF
jgi:predicted porin